MRNNGIGSWPARRIRTDAEKTAILYEGRRYSYQDLHDRSLRLAHALRAAGVGQGDRVAYLGLNHPTLAEALFAAGILGAVLLPLNTRLAAPEHSFILRDAEPRVLIHGQNFAQVVGQLDDDVTPATVIVVEDDGPDGYEARLAAASIKPIDELVTLDDLCMIQYTSGTTGRPKGVMITHGNITWNSINMMIDVDITTDEVSLLTVPMFHTAGINNCFLTTVLKGGTVIIMRSWNPEDAIDLIAEHGVTMMLGVPTIFLTMSQSPRWDSADFSSIRSLPCGAAPLPRSLIETYLDRGMKFLQGYGMTESSPNATFLREDRSVDKLGSAGTPCFFTDLRIVDPMGDDLAPVQKGEVLLQGPNIMAGYWKLPEVTADTMDEDGWLRTGDVALKDNEGFVFIVDRMKDMIISGGENIYPAEVEDALYRHPAVKECAVIGVTDARWGEVGHAFVVLHGDRKATAEDFDAHMRAQLASYKVPKSYQVLEHLPRNASGKLVKNKLRQQAAAAGGPLVPDPAST